MIHEVAMGNFETIVDSNEIVFLDFWAAWCSPCKVFAPVYEEAARRNSRQQIAALRKAIEFF